MKDDISNDLAWAIGHDDAATMQQLIRDQGRSTMHDRSGNTLLHLAASANATACAEALVAAGVDIDARNGWGNTPLWMALFSSRGDGRLITHLLDHGADPDAVNNAGRTPRDVAKLVANYDLAQFFEGR